MNIAIKLTSPKGYRALVPETVSDYLASSRDLATRLGGKPKEWQVREVGDGNLNLVFIIEGPASSLCLKQALPYVRLVGESWPLPLSRAWFEHLALTEEAKYAPRFVPATHYYDDTMALTVMEYLTPHIILRKGLIQGIKYPLVAKHLGEFLALTLYHTSDLFLPAEIKKKKIADFADNTAMCKISEDLIFDEPYFKAPMNRHSVGLDEVSVSFQNDADLKDAVQEMKWRFLNHAEAMIHGDLHTGSVMVTENDTRAIDPEFAFFGPMGFDIGAIIGNFLLAYFSQPGHAKKSGEREAYADWILAQIPVLWQSFSVLFADLCQQRTSQEPGGHVYAPRVLAMREKAIKQRLDAIWSDTLGFAGAKIIRRTLGLAHVEDMESIEDLKLRASCERKALLFAKELLLNRENYTTPSTLVDAARLK